MKFHFQVIMKDGKPAMSFGSDEGRIRFTTWMKKNVGKFGTIEPRDKITREARGYFEGALCPSYLVWMKANPHDKDNLEAVREIFKLEFNGQLRKGLDGKPMKLAKSTARLTRVEFREFTTKIIEYFVENGIPVPNPDLYKKWADEWRGDYPLLSFWQFLEHFDIKCDTGVSEVKRLVPQDERKVEYPTGTNNTAF